MKFLCLGYFDSERMDALSPAELDAVMRECGPHLEELRASGRLVLDAGVSTEARHVWREGAKLQVSDRSANESTEQVGCAFFVEARDLEQAVEIASIHPTTRVDAGERLGWRIEIRPVHHFEDTRRST